jgi:hypothetical protein
MVAIRKQLAIQLDFVLNEFDGGRRLVRGKEINILSPNPIVAIFMDYALGFNIHNK